MKVLRLIDFDGIWEANDWLRTYKYEVLSVSYAVGGSKILIAYYEWS